MKTYTPKKTDIVMVNYIIAGGHKFTPGRQMLYGKLCELQKMLAIRYKTSPSKIMGEWTQINIQL